TSTKTGLQSSSPGLLAQAGSFMRRHPDVWLIAALSLKRAARTAAHGGGDRQRVALQVVGAGRNVHADVTAYALQSAAAQSGVILVVDIDGVGGESEAGHDSAHGDI